MATRIINFDDGFTSGTAPVGDASADDVSVIPSGNLTSTNVQDALEELQLDLDDLEDYVNDELDLKLDVAELGIPNGAASLNGSGKLEDAQIPDALLGALRYQSTWNASTNSPSLVDGVGTKGYYYVVATAGTTSLNGYTDWQIGDWVVYNGTVWQPVDNSDKVSSVAGKVGVVTLTSSDVGLGNVDNTSDATKNAAAVTLTNKTLTSPVVNGANVTMGTGTNSNRLVIPNVTTSQRTALTNAAGLIVFDTDLSAFYFNTGSTWVATGAGFTNPMTTAGDTIIGGVSGAAGRLAIGSTNQLLSVVSGAPAWRTGIVGVTTNSASPAGYVGEYIFQKREKSIGVSLTTANETTINNLTFTLAAGDWDVGAMFALEPAATTNVTFIQACICLTNNSRPTSDASAVPNANGEVLIAHKFAAHIPNGDIMVTIPTYRISLATSTTFYLTGRGDFTVSTCRGYGSIFARRVT